MIRDRGGSLFRRLREASVVLATLLFSGCCCDGCCKCCGDVVSPAAWQAPPDGVAVTMITAALASHAEIATSMCGIPAVGLSDIQVEEVPEAVGLPWTGKFKVRGKAIAKNGAGASSPVACSGVVSWTIHSKVEDGEVKGWQIDALDLWEVSTPGVTFSRPSGDGDDWD